MENNINTIESRMMCFSDFMRGQGIVATRCDEIVTVCETLKAVALKYDGKKRLLKFVAEVRDNLKAGLHIELTAKSEGYRRRLYVTTDTTDQGLRDTRANHPFLFDIMVYEVTDRDGRVNANIVAMIADTEIARAQARKAMAKDACREFDKWSGVFSDAVEDFYRKVKEGVPQWFLELESRYVGKLPLA